jgi:hypothetical protein
MFEISVRLVVRCFELTLSQSIDLGRREPDRHIAAIAELSLANHRGMARSGHVLALGCESLKLL